MLMLKNNKKTFHRLRRPKGKEGGNVLFIILIGIIALALLTQMVSKSSELQSDTLSRQAQDDEISRMLTQSATLSSALYQMVVNGEDAATLYLNLSTLKPGDIGFETSPHSLKIYHPFGGGITPMSDSSSSSLAVATDFNISKASIVTGVGATDTLGDILFTTKISSESLCQKINKILTGSTAVPPILTTADFDLLFAGTAITIANGNCASCVNIPRLCVSNTNASAWGFYASLLPK
ncbi:MAG: hypothetical protein KAH96_06880 [Alphaproteobacteria bacterium]|nr:hypothetical protein [Alphaproteobacteria bacterium]